MARLWVKICGLTNPADSRAAVAAGADALGFNFWPGSVRYVDPADAGWVAEIEGSERVAVLVNPSLSEALRIAEIEGIDSLQLHGEESPEFCARLVECGVKLTKAIPVSAYPGRIIMSDFRCARFLLDTMAEGRFGGTGQTFAWERAAALAVSHPAYQIVIAGGLTPENVARAVGLACPFGVDVSSGVEENPRQKNHALIGRFIEAARSV